MNLIPPFVRRRIAHRPNLVKIVDNIGWLFLDKFLRMGVGLLVGVWIARYLGPEQFGLLSFALAFTGLFGAIATLGLRGIVVRDIVREPETAKLALGTAALMQLIGGFISYLLILSAIAYLRPDDALARSLVAILGSMMLFKASDIAVYWFESQVKSKYVVWVQNSIFVAFAAIKVALIIRHAPLIAFAWATLAEAIIVALTLLMTMSRRGQPLLQLRGSMMRAQTMLKESWPLIISGLALMTQAYIDQIMLGQMVGDIEVGYYSVALQITVAASVTSMIMHSTFFPSIASAKKVSKTLYLERLGAFYKLNVTVSFLIAIPLAILSPVIIETLFGTDFSPAAPILTLMTIRLVFTHIGVARGIYLLNEDLLKFSALTMIAGTIINVILNHYLIPSYEAVGATIASLISFSISTFALDLCYSRTRKNASMMLRSIIYFYTILNLKNQVKIFQ